MGYMSVRTRLRAIRSSRPSSSTRPCRAEKQAGVLVHGLRAGRVIKNNLWGRVNGALRMGVFSKCCWGMGVVVAAAMAAARLEWAGADFGLWPRVAGRGGAGGVLLRLHALGVGIAAAADAQVG